MVVAKWFLHPAPAQGSLNRPPDFAQTLIFTDQMELLTREARHITPADDQDQPVSFINNRQTVTAPQPGSAGSLIAVGNILSKRPTTSVLGVP